jgi:hypothetical protein
VEDHLIVYLCTESVVSYCMITMPSTFYISSGAGKTGMFIACVGVYGWCEVAYYLYVLYSLKGASKVRKCLSGSNQSLAPNSTFLPHSFNVNHTNLEEGEGRRVYFKTRRRQSVRIPNRYILAPKDEIYWRWKAFLLDGGLLHDSESFI